MKIAIPVKTNNENPAVAPLFGKAKWFAFIEDATITIEQSPIQEGRAVAEWLINSNVDTIIMQEMGNGPYSVIQAHGGIKVYHTGYDRITLNEVLEQFHAGLMSPIDENQMQNVLAHHESKHTHDGHHDHGHHHHH